MAKELSEETKKDLMTFQSMQQQVQVIAMQKQQVAIQLTDLDVALKEIENSSGTCYRYAGTIIVPKEKDALKKE
ncbi:MAG: prefoldin subunit, partial [Nitrosopumilaceae archaeon]